MVLMISKLIKIWSIGERTLSHSCWFSVIKNIQESVLLFVVRFRNRKRLGQVPTTSRNRRPPRPQPQPAHSWKTVLVFSPRARARGPRKSRSSLTVLLRLWQPPPPSVNTQITSYNISFHRTGSRNLLKYKNLDSKIYLLIAGPQPDRVPRQSCTIVRWSTHRSII